MKPHPVSAGGEGGEDVLLRACEQAERRLAAVIEDAFAVEGSWRERLRAAAYAAARFAAEHPRQIRLLGLEALWISAGTRACRERVVRRCIELVDAGRAEAPDPDAVNALAAECAVGAAATALTRALHAGGLEDPEGAVPQFMYLAVLSYLGDVAAGEELSVLVPARVTR